MKRLLDLSVHSIPWLMLILAALTLVTMIVVLMQKKTPGQRYEQIIILKNLLTFLVLHLTPYSLYHEKALVYSNQFFCTGFLQIRKAGI